MELVDPQTHISKPYAKMYENPGVPKVRSAAWFEALRLSEVTSAEVQGIWTRYRTVEKPPVGEILPSVAEIAHLAIKVTTYEDLPVTEAA